MEVTERLDLERGDAYGRSFGDVYDRWYDGVTDAEATADFVAARHPGGPVLELGVGTGRLARPLTERGLTVVGLDASADMLAHCPAGSGLHPIRADMRALPFAPTPATRFGSALVAFNTLFNLTTAETQASLLADLARLLDPRGLVVVEMLDVSALVDGPDRSIGRRGATADPVVVTATDLDRRRQLLRGQHVEVSDGGIVVRPWLLRWVTADQLDTMADRAGLRLGERFASWDGAPHRGDATSVISVYHRRPPG